LFQVTSNARRQSASMETHSSLKAQLAEYAKFADHLVAKYGQAPLNASATSSNHTNEITSEEKEAVRVVLQFIEDMYASLLFYHMQDVTASAKCTQQFISDECELSTAQNATIHAWHANMTAARIAHITCRANLTVACNRGDAECTDYDNYRKYDGAAQLPGCVEVVSGPEADVPNLAAFSAASIQTDDMGQLSTMESCLKQTKENWFDPLYGRYLKCTRDHELCSNCQACESSQMHFEEKHCEWYNGVNLTCHGVRGCLELETEFCKNECANIGTREEARKADNETGQRLVCLLHVIFGEPHNVSDVNSAWDPPVAENLRQQALSACKVASYPTPDWSITCDPGSWQLPDACDQSGEHKTCTEDFKTAEYDGGQESLQMYDQTVSAMTCSDKNHGKYVDDTSCTCQ